MTNPSAIPAPAGWTQQDNALVLERQFAHFAAAFGFLVQVAILAEKADHHPEIWNVYSKVRLRLTTHDAGNTITHKDYALAARISELLL